MNNRRKLVIALGAGALVAPFVSFAQAQGKIWRVGFLSPLPSPASIDSGDIGVFLRGMRELGYFEGKNLLIEWRFADFKVERFPDLAAELARLKMDVFVTTGTPAALAAQKSTTSIPIVIVSVADPVGSGLVKTLGRPGGNITGVSNLATDISPKLLEMLLSMAPKLSHIAVLVNPDNVATVAVSRNVQAAAPGGKVKVMPVEARTSQDFEKAFSAMARGKAGAFIIPRDVVFATHLRQIAELAAKYRLLSISTYLGYAEAGGLMVYGASSADQYRRIAIYVDKILKGTKPGDLPVEQPTKFELVINGKTAKTLRLKIPQSLLIMADRVIE